MSNLKKGLNLPVLVLLAVNAIIGTGIFFMPSIAAGIAGPASIISWLVAAFIAILISMSFAELSSLFSNAGGVYEYTKAAFGGAIAFLVGWISWIVSNVTIAIIVTGSTSFFSTMMGLPSWMALLIGLGFVILINYISYRGIDISAKVAIFFSLITLIAIIVLGAVGVISFNSSNLFPFFVFPTAAIFSTIYLINETFFGWESVSFLAEETKNSRKVMPLVMILSTVIVSVLVLVIVFIALSSMPWQEFSKSGNTILEIARINLPAPMFMAVALLFLLNLIGTAVSLIISTPRLVFAMSRDEVLPNFLSRIHPIYATPYYAIFIQVLVTCLVMITNSYLLLMETMLPLAIFMYAIVLLAVPRLRKTMPNEKRYFKMPFGNVLPYIIIIALVATLFMGFNSNGVILGVSLILLGLPLYFIALAGYYDKFIKFTGYLLSGLTHSTYHFLVEGQVFQHMYTFLNDVTINTIIDLGCGVGVITRKIANNALSLNGKIYGIDFEKHAIDIAERSKQNQDIPNVEFIQGDLYKVLSSPKTKDKLKSFDAMVGIGILENVHDPKSLLKLYSRHLRKGGKFYFIDYDFVGPIFDKPWIEKNNEIVALFRSAGLRVKIYRQHRILWQYVHMYGTKD